MSLNKNWLLGLNDTQYNNLKEESFNPSYDDPCESLEHAAKILSTTNSERRVSQVWWVKNWTLKKIHSLYIPVWADV